MKQSDIDRTILGVRVDAISYDDTCNQVLSWARSQRNGFVSCANVHSIMEAYDSPDFRKMLNCSSLVTPDGMPVVWGLRWLGISCPSRVYGPDLTIALLARADQDGLRVGFFGSHPQVLQRLLVAVHKWYPGLQVGYAYSPPFRTLSTDEDDVLVEAINRSGVQILFVGLGCPKQEQWMAEHIARLNPVLLGVGAAFDFLSGSKAQAPKWMRHSGLEWGFRLLTEPRRLWRRYAQHNFRFIAFLCLQRGGLRSFANLRRDPQGSNSAIDKFEARSGE